MQVSDANTAIVIAEVGATHLGSVDRAKGLIRLACLAGADYVKFQKRNPIESIPKDIQNVPHPNQIFAYGETYLKHRIALELNISQHILLKQYCEQIGIGYSTSVWDVTSAGEVISLKPDYIKVPSACNSNFQLLDFLFDEFNGDVHLSLGMTTHHEAEMLVNYLDKKRVYTRVVLYHCTSEYPCPFDRLYLSEISHLKTISPLFRIGFSNHGLGICTDIAAYMLGARWFERHFIDDRTTRHTDAAASLEPDGLRRLCRDLKAIPKALQYKKEMSEEESKQRYKLKYRDDDD